MQLGKHQTSKRGQMNMALLASPIRLESCVRHIVDSYKHSISLRTLLDTPVVCPLFFYAPLITLYMGLQPHSENIRPIKSQTDLPWSY